MKKIFFVFIGFLIFSPLTMFAMANPASVYCIDNGGVSVINQDTSVGLCKFKDGTECEEWAYYRKSCDPGQYIDWANNKKVIKKDILSNEIKQPAVSSWQNSQNSINNQGIDINQNNNVFIIVLCILVVVLGITLFFNSKKR